MINPLKLRKFKTFKRCFQCQPAPVRQGSGWDVWGDIRGMVGMHNEQKTKGLEVAGFFIFDTTAGPDTSPLYQLNLSSYVPVPTELIPLVHIDILKLS